MRYLLAIILLTSAAVHGQTTSMALKDGSNVDPATWRTKLNVPTTAVIDVTASPYSAVGDGKIGDGAVMNSGSATLTLSGGSFAVSDIGKYIRVVGAGSGGADLVTTISARASTSSITLAANASTAVTSAQIVYGTNSTTAIQAAIDAANASTTIKTVLIPAGKFICNVTSYPNVRIEGVAGLVGQSAFTAISLNNTTGFSILLPAVRTSAVIKFASAGGSEISDLCIIAGDGTLAADRFGTGIEIGDPLNTVDGPVAAGFRISQTEVNGFHRGMTYSRCWDNVVEMCQVNFCNQGFFGGEITSGGAESNSGPADGMVFQACGSNYTDVVFNLLGSKQSAVICGDYNRMQKFARLDASSLYVSNVNLETITQVIFHLVAGSGPSFLEVGHMLPLNNSGAGVWNERTDSDFVSIFSSSSGFTYCTTRSDGYPRQLPANATILRYTDTTWTTVFRTELASKIYRVTTENTFNFAEDFVRRTSPYGSLGWIGTAIAGTAAQYTSENDLFKIYLDASTKQIRFAPEYAFMDFAGDWTLSWVISPSDTSTTIFRCGLYSVDTSSPTLTPTNGIGLRMDTSSPNSDTTARLEVIVGGVVQTTVDTGVTLATMQNVRTEMILERQGNVIRLYLRDTNKTRRAVQVSYSGTLPNSYCAPAILMGGTSGARQVLFKSLKFSR